MTRTSSFFGIPLPKDAKSLDEISYTTESGAAPDFVGFYQQWMGNHGWIYQPEFSRLDGHPVSQQTWCKNTRPITTVGIHISSGTADDRHSMIAIAVLEDEDSCP